MKAVHEVVAALCFLALSVFVIWTSWSMEYYTTMGPGAGFFPFWLGVAMAGFSLICLVQASMRKEWPRDAAFLPVREGIVQILSLIAGVAER